MSIKDGNGSGHYAEPDVLAIEALRVVSGTEFGAVRGYGGRICQGEEVHEVITRGRWLGGLPAAEEHHDVVPWQQRLSKAEVRIRKDVGQPASDRLAVNAQIVVDAPAHHFCERGGHRRQSTFDCQREDGLPGRVHEERRLNGLQIPARLDAIDRYLPCGTKSPLPRVEWWVLCIWQVPGPYGCGGVQGDDPQRAELVACDVWVDRRVGL